MTSRTRLVAASTVLTLCVPALAMADTPVGWERGGRANGTAGEAAEYSWETSIGLAGEAGERGEYASTGRGRTGPPAWTVTYREVVTDPLTGQPCTQIRYLIGDDAAGRGAAADQARLQEDAFVATYGTDPPPACSGLQIDPGAPAREAAALVAGRIQPAEPSVQPDDRAITGFRSHLRTNLDSSYDEVVRIEMFGSSFDVDVSVEGVHTIDWGDGTVTTAVTGDGGGWHDGPAGADDITHHYLTRGSHPLVVTTSWTVTATLGTTTDSQTVTTTSLPVPIDVTEVRSVRTG